MEAKTKAEIVKEAIEWSASCGRGGDLKDVIVFLVGQIDAQKQTIETLRESNEGQAELIRKLKEDLEKQTDRAERAEKEIRTAKAMHTMDMIDAEIDARRYDDETVITINRKPQEILNVSILFANANEEEEEEDGEN